MNRFKNYSLSQLIKRIEKAPDFKYDDEEVELTRRLDSKGLTWKWTKDNKIKIREAIKWVKYTRLEGRQS